MKSEIFALLVLFYLCLHPGLYSQRQITTLSGQKILLLQNGSWHKAEHTDIKTDSLPQSLYQDSLVEKTSGIGFISNNETTKGIDSIIHLTEKKEIETFILLDILDKEIAIKEVQLSQARQLKNKESENLLKTEISDLKAKQKTADKIYKLDAEYVKKANNLKTLQGADLAKSLIELGSIIGINVDSFIPKNSAIITNTVEKSPEFKKIKLKKDVCLFSRDENIKNERIVETKQEPFYTFTPEKLKNYFKEKELMTVTTSVMKKNKDYLFHIIIKISSKDAAKNYGYLSKESMMRIQFITGNSINLYCTEDVYGNIEAYTGNVVYNAEYKITKEDIKPLLKNPLDKIGIMWTSGFESYDIYHVDLIMNHLSCLKSI